MTVAVCVYVDTQTHGGTGLVTRMGPGLESTHSRARDVPRAMFQRDKSDRLAYRFVDHVRGRRDDATRGSRRARDAWDAWDANVHWECGGE